MVTWEELEQRCRQCQNCPLAETRTNVVFGTGSRQADILFIGEGPGEQEDLQGVPFVGPAGKLLDRMLSVVDLSRETVYIANIVKCRPPRNRDPLHTEQDACIGYLRAQTALLRPKIIVCLGRIAATRLIDKNFRITRQHGQWFDRAGVLMTATYHPSAVLRDPDYTTERMIEALRLLRQDYGFGGYIHAKAIPGADPLLTQQLGLLADRLSVNIELPSAKSLALLAPDKGRAGILAPMAQIRDGITQSRQELAKYHHAPRFAPAGQSTQMIVGATPESDRHILMLTQGLYDKYHLKRVFYSAYIPVSSSSLLPAPQGFQPPLLREHRLYQADWLLRFYHFRAEELLDEGRPDFDLRLDPKCGWALRHLDQFPVEVQRADYEALLRVPGIGVTSAKRILTARRAGPLSFSGLKKLGVVLKRAQYFITCSGRMLEGLRVREEGILSHLAALDRPALAQVQPEQLSLFGEEGAS